MESARKFYQQIEENFRVEIEFSSSSEDLDVLINGSETSASEARGWLEKVVTNDLTISKILVPKISATSDISKYTALKLLPDRDIRNCYQRKGIIFGWAFRGDHLVVCLHRSDNGHEDDIVAAIFDLVDCSEYPEGRRQLTPPQQKLIKTQEYEDIHLKISECHKLFHVVYEPRRHKICVTGPRWHDEDFQKIKGQLILYFGPRVGAEGHYSFTCLEDLRLFRLFHEKAPNHFGSLSIEYDEDILQCSFTTTQDKDQVTQNIDKCVESIECILIMESCTAYAEKLSLEGQYTGGGGRKTELVCRGSSQPNSRCRGLNMVSVVASHQYKVLISHLSDSYLGDI